MFSCILKKVRFTDNKDRVFKSTIRSDKLGSDSFCLFLCDPNLIIEPQQYMFIQFSNCDNWLRNMHVRNKAMLPNKITVLFAHQVWCGINVWLDANQIFVSTVLGLIFRVLIFFMPVWLISMHKYIARI